MAHRYSPTIRRRRLSAELLRIRRQAGLKTEELAAKIPGMSKSTYSNIETGIKQRPKISEVRAILDACGLEPGQEAAEILDLCRQSQERGWWSRYGDVLSTKYVGFEVEARSITTWEPNTVPGLLQVPEYVEVIARAALARPDEVRRSVESRAKRQEILEEDPPELWAVFDETALLRLDEYPEVRRSQIEHLLEISERPYVTLQMTEARRLHPGSAGPFVILEFDRDPTVVYLETDTDGLYLESPEEISRYLSLVNHLRLGALRPGETIVRLREMID